MIFEYYVPEQVPYGANILITSTDSSFSTKIPVGGIEFITSQKEVNTMTFQYEEKNGTLVDIITNLDLKKWDKTKKTFTVSNETIFSTGVKPYIQLCCNNVKLPISFVQVGNLTNKWAKTEVNNTNITLYGYEDDEDSNKRVYATFTRNIIVSWDKDEANQQIFINKNTSGMEQGGTEFYGCYATYFYLDSNDNLNKDTNQQVFIGQGGAPSSGYVTIPRLDGIQSSVKNGTTKKITKKFYKYFMLGLLVRITGSGYESYKHNTVYYVGNTSSETNKTYNNTDFLGSVKGKQILLSEDGIPLLLSASELDYKWNSNFFYITKKGQYISPSSSQIYTEYDFGDYICSSHTLCYTECDSNKTMDCSCNYLCSNYSNSGPDPTSIEDLLFMCEPYWGCYQNNGISCKFYNNQNSGWSSYDPTCYEYCATDSNNRCSEYYKCLDYYSDVEEIYCNRCYGYYSVCKKFLTCENCEGYCKCNLDEYCGSDCPSDSSPECPADGSSSCPSHNKPSGGTVTVPALRQLNGEWGADCTKRIYYVTSGTWSSSEVFIPAGSYTEVTYYNWPGGFMYKGAFHTYP